MSRLHVHISLIQTVTNNDSNMKARMCLPHRGGRIASGSSRTDSNRTSFCRSSAALGGGARGAASVGSVWPWPGSFSQSERRLRVVIVIASCTCFSAAGCVSGPCTLQACGGQTEAGHGIRSPALTTRIQVDSSFVVFLSLSLGR